MKKAHITLICLALMCFTLTCKKTAPVEEASKTTEVYGKILQFGTSHKATSEICTVRAYYKRAEPGVLFGTNHELVGEGVTDTNGNYKLIFEAENLKDWSSYFMRLETTIHNHFDPTTTTHVIKPGKSQEIKLEYVPYAWMQLHVKNVNPQTGDRLSIWLGSNQSYTFWGPANSQVILRSAGNFLSKPEANLFRNGVWQKLPLEVYLTPFDTTYHLLEY